MVYKQEQPNTIKLELTEGCNRFCSFCGIRGIRTKPNENLKFMSLFVAEKIIDRVRSAGWNSRFELAMHGEPSLNLNMVNIITLIRQNLPKASIMLTSNGVMFLTTKDIRDVLSVGLNCLAFDDYGQLNLIKHIWPEFKIYPENKNMNPYRRRKYAEHDVVIMPDISKTKGGVHSSKMMCNHCGCAAPKNNKQEGKRCARPFREIAITYDGMVIVCCNDWRRTFPIDSAVLTNIEDIWQSEKFQAIRRQLYHGQRISGPCNGCDSRSYRVGLLPDKSGNFYIQKPDKWCQDIIDNTLKEGPMTKPILRNWEC